jgi:hypothetical protein
MKKLAAYLLVVLGLGVAFGNDYYDHTTFPQTGAAASSSAMRAELDTIEAGFNKLPTLSGNGNKLVKVNSGATALSTSAVISEDGTDATITGDLYVTGAQIGQNSGQKHTIPAVASDTMALIAATQTFTNKTIVAANNTITTAASGNLIATSLNAALAELQGDIDTLTGGGGLADHLADTIGAHAASAISYVGGSGMSATDIEAAVDELATEKANLAGGTFSGDISVPDEAYSESGWNGSLEAPTKNAVRDEVETLWDRVDNIGLTAAFSARSAASQSVTTGTLTKVTLGTEIFDTNNAFASSRFTATTAGYYQVNGGFRAVATNMTAGSANIYKNGSIYRTGTSFTIVATTTGNAISVADVVHLDVGEYVELYGVVSGTSPEFDHASATNGAYFSGALVKPD